MKEIHLTVMESAAEMPSMTVVESVIMIHQMIILIKTVLVSVLEII